MLNATIAPNYPLSICPGEACSFIAIVFFRLDIPGLGACAWPTPVTLIMAFLDITQNKIQNHLITRKAMTMTRPWLLCIFFSVVFEAAIGFLQPISPVRWTFREALSVS
jgi:hypothetical protein